MIKFFLFIAVWLMGSLPVLANGGITAKVIAVVDGNTLEVQNQENEKLYLVLSGVDCPELDQAYGDAARRFMEKKTLKKDVFVTFTGKDRYGNHVAIVLLKKDDLRIELLKEGLAWTTEKNPDPALECLRDQAAQRGKGLWKEDNPVPPWTFRRQKSMEQPKSS